MGVPQGRVEEPEARVGVPVARVEEPEARVGVPVARVEEPEASVGGSGGQGREVGGLRRGSLVTVQPPVPIP